LSHLQLEFTVFDGAGPKEFAFGPDVYRFVGFPGPIADLAEVDFRDLGFLMDLLFLQFWDLSLADRNGFFPLGNRRIGLILPSLRVRMEPS